MGIDWLPTTFFIFFSASTPAGIVTARIRFASNNTIKVEPFTQLLEETATLAKTQQDTALAIACDKLYDPLGILDPASLIPHNIQSHPFGIIVQKAQINGASALMPSLQQVSPILQVISRIAGTH